MIKTIYTQVFFPKKHKCKNPLNIDDIYKNTILMHILPSTIYLVQGRGKKDNLLVSGF